MNPCNYLSQVFSLMHQYDWIKVLHQITQLIDFAYKVNKDLSHTRLSRSCPIIPASAHITRFFSSIHLMAHCRKVTLKPMHIVFRETDIAWKYFSFCLISVKLNWEYTGYYIFYQWTLFILHNVAPSKISTRLVATGDLKPTWATQHYLQLAP